MVEKLRFCLTKRTQTHMVKGVKKKRSWKASTFRQVRIRKTEIPKSHCFTYIFIESSEIPENDKILDLGFAGSCF